MMKFTVLQNGRKVLTFTDEPGVLMSTAIRPAGFAPPKHPFINGQALDANAEDTLATLLEKSRSAAEFVTQLEKHGFEVQKDA